MAGGKNVCILNVGTTNTGKSTETRNQINMFGANRDIEIYDVNNEFNDIVSYERLEQHDEFVDRIKNMTDTVFVFEEATVFFSNRGRSQEVLQMIVAKRHNNNDFIFNFHSIRAIPSYILDITDYIYLRKTRDTKSTAKNKCDDETFIECFEHVRKSKNPYEVIVFKPK